MLKYFALAMALFASPAFAGSGTVAVTPGSGATFQTTTNGSSNNLSQSTIWDYSAAANGWSIDSSHGGLVAGEGTAGTAAGGILTVQGVASMTPLLAAQSGTWNITNVTGTVVLPTGASTSANQTSQITQETSTATNTGTAATNTGTTNTDLGPPGATACSTDTGSCSVNSLLQRIAQRISSLITALGSPFQAGGSIGNTSFGAATSPVTTNPTSTLTLPATTTAYTAGQLIASSATAGSVVVPSFAIANSAGGAIISRLRLTTNDSTSTAWGSQTIQVDLWSTAPTFTNGDRGAYAIATGSAGYLGSFTCAVSAEAGDGAYAACAPTVGNAATIKLASGTSVFWSLDATTGSGVTGASKVFTLTAELLN